MSQYSESIELLAFKNNTFIPNFIEESMNFILDGRQALDNLLQKNYSPDEQAKYLQNLDGKGFFDFSESTHPSLAYSLIMNFTNSIPSSLINYLPNQNGDISLESVIEIVNRLNPFKYTYLSRLIGFFVYLLKSQKDKKVTYEHFSIVLAPNIFSLSHSDPKAFESANLSIKIALVLLQKYSAIFQNCSSLGLHHSFLTTSQFEAQCQSAFELKKESVKVLFAEDEYEIPEPPLEDSFMSLLPLETNMFLKQTRLETMTRNIVFTIPSWDTIFDRLMETPTQK